MKFSELVANVVNDTSRPDLGLKSAGGDGQITAAVFAGILALHNIEFWYKDILTAQWVADTAAYIQTMDLSSLPRFKALTYVRKMDAAYNASQLDPTVFPPIYNGTTSLSPTLALAPFAIKTMDDIFDEYGAERRDIAYAAGSTLFMKSSTSFSKAQISWYAYPFLDTANEGAGLKSWIAEEYPYAVIYWATSKIFTASGELDAARKYDSPADARRGYEGGLVQQQIAHLIRMNLSPLGR